MVNTFSSSQSNAELYAEKGMNFSSGIYKFNQTTTLETSGSQINFLSGAKIILNSQKNKLTLKDSNLTITQGFNLEILLSTDFVRSQGFYAIQGESITLSEFTSSKNATSSVTLKNADGTAYTKPYIATVKSDGLYIQVPEPSNAALAIALLALGTIFYKYRK